MTRICVALAVATCAHFGGLLPVVTAVETCDGAEPVNSQLGTSAVQKILQVRPKDAASETEGKNITIQVTDVNPSSIFGKHGFFFSIHNPGSDLHGSTLKQCRDGGQIWEGKIILRKFPWWPGQAGEHTGWRECGGAEGNWAIGDTLTTADKCPPPPPPPATITDINRPGHLGPSGFYFSLDLKGRDLNGKCVEVIRNGKPVFETMIIIQKFKRWKKQAGDVTGRRERGGRGRDWAVGDKLYRIKCTRKHHWMYR